MIEYITLAFYIVFVSVFFQKKKKLLFLLTFVPLILFFGTRVDFGADYETYLQDYELQHDWTLSKYLISFMGGKFEPGFFFLIKICPSFDSLIFVCTALVLVPVAIFFYEFIPKGLFPLAFVLYLFNPSIFDSIIAMRSGIVIGLFLLAVVLKNRGFKIIAFLLVLLSGFFHLSGFLLVLFFLFSNKSLKHKRELLSSFIIVLMIIALLFSTIFGNLFMSIEMFSVYNGHITNTEEGIGFYFFSIIRVGFVIYILSLLRKGIIEDKYIWIAWLTIFDYFFFMIQGIDIMYRFVYYFYVVSIFFKCYVLRVDKSAKSTIYVGLSIAYLVYQFIGLTQFEQTRKYLWDYNSFLF